MAKKEKKPQPERDGHKDSSNKSGKGARKLALKREAALGRQADYADLSTEDKLTRINQRPGNSRRERSKLGG